MTHIKTQKLSIDKNTFHIDLWIAVMTVTVIGCVIWSLRNIALGTHDDLNTYVKIKEQSIIKYMSDTLISMLTRGRFSLTMIITNILFYYFTKNLNQFVYNLVMYIPIVFNIFFFAYIIGKRYSKYLGLAVPVFFFTFIQVDFNHNLMVSFPLFFHVGFLMFLIGVELYIEHFEKKIKSYLWLSALFMFDSFSTYESFVTYFAVFILISMFYNYSSGNFLLKKYIKLNLNKIKYHFFAVMLYVLIYVVCRKIWSFNYGGATIDMDSFRAELAFKTLFTFSFSLFPVREFFTGDTADRFTLANIGLRMLAKAGAASIAMAIILVKSTQMRNSRLLPVIFTSLVASIVFCIPHALTPQYQTWVSSGTTGFVPSFFSYMWIVLILCTIVIYLCNIHYIIKIPLITIIVIGVFLGSIMTDFSNSATIKVKQADTMRYKLFERLVQSSFYASIEENAEIYVVNYIGIHYRLEALGKYGSLYSGKTLKYSNNIDEVLKAENKYYMAYSYSDNCIYMCKMTGYMVGDTLFTIAYDNKISRLTSFKKSQVEDDALSEGLQKEFNYMYLSQPYDFQNGVIISTEDLDLHTLDLVPFP